MKVTIQAYYFMDKLFLTKADAQQMAEGWEHYESIERVYISISQDDFMEAQQETDITTRIEILEYADKSIFETYEEAEEESRTENEEEGEKEVKRLSDETWINIFRNLSEMKEEDYYDESLDWVEVVWLEGSNNNSEWVLAYGEELFEDGFKTEKEAMDRLHQLEQKLLK